VELAIFKTIPITGLINNKPMVKGSHPKISSFFGNRCTSKKRKYSKNGKTKNEIETQPTGKKKV
jgi:hypothetical protein